MRRLFGTAIANQDAHTLLKFLAPPSDSNRRPADYEVSSAPNHRE